MTHGKIVCVCGRLIAQCRCIHAHEIEVRSPCTHGEQLPVAKNALPDLFEPHQEPTVFDTMHAHYALHKIDAPTHTARHIINDGRGDFETSDGLAFTIGVCIIEAETRKEFTTVFTVMHPNRVPLYTIWYDSDTHTVTVKPVVA